MKKKIDSFARLRPRSSVSSAASLASPPPSSLLCDKIGGLVSSSYSPNLSISSRATFDGKLSRVSEIQIFEPFVVQGLKVDLIERGRIVYSLVVPPRLLNTGNSLHGGATATLVDLVGSAVIFSMGAPMTEVYVEINVSYLDATYVGEKTETDIKQLRKRLNFKATPMPSFYSEAGQCSDKNK